MRENRKNPGRLKRVLNATICKNVLLKFSSKYGKFLESAPLVTEAGVTLNYGLDHNHFAGGRNNLKLCLIRS